MGHFQFLSRQAKIIVGFVVGDRFGIRHGRIVTGYVDVVKLTVQQNVVPRVGFTAFFTGSRCIAAYVAKAFHNQHKGLGVACADRLILYKTTEGVVAVGILQIVNASINDVIVYGKHLIKYVCFEFRLCHHVVYRAFQNASHCRNYGNDDSLGKLCGKNHLLKSFSPCDNLKLSATGQPKNFRIIVQHCTESVCDRIG